MSHSSTQVTLTAIAEQMKLQYRTTTQMASSAIREAILNAIFLPGAPLNVSELAEWLGVSRTPIRTALAELETEGLVVSLPQRSAVVAEPDVDNFLQAYEICSQLELLAIETAIASMTPERLAALDRLDAELEHAEGDAVVELQDDFYNVLYDKMNHPMLTEMIEQFRTEINQYTSRLRVDSGTTERHRYLLDYAHASDVRGAHRYISDHLQSIRNRFADK